MPTLQVRVDEKTKAGADRLFADLGLDTSTAVRMFLAAALDRDGLPFDVKRTASRTPNADLRQAMDDVMLRRDLHGPYTTADEAMRSMLAD